MQLDPNIVGHAARSMREAVRHADAAAATDVPLFLGRGPATDAVRAHAGDAAEWSRSAQSVLGPFDGALGDARTAAATLADHMDAIRWDDGVNRLRRDLGTRHAVDAVRDAVTLLEQVEGGLRAPIGQLGSRLATADERVVATVAASRLDELGSAGPFLAERTNGADDLLPSLGTPISSDLLDTHWERLLRASTQRDVGVDTLRAAFRSVVDASALPARDAMPAWLHEVPVGTRLTLDRAQADELRYVATAATREDVAARMLEQLAVRTPDKDAIRLVDTARTLPPHLLVDLPLPDASPSLRDMVGVETHGLHLAHLLPLEHAYVALATSSDSLLAREVERLVHAPAGSGTDHLRRLGLLGLERPDAVLGDASALPWSRELLRLASEPHAPEQERALAAAFDFVRRTGGDRDALLDGLEQLVRTPAEKLSWEQLAPAFALRMLPDDARPRGAALIQERLYRTFNGMHDQVNPREFDAVTNDIQLIVDADRLARSSNTTRAGVTAELDQLISQPFDDLDEPSRRRLSLLMLQPPELLPVVSADAGAFARPTHHLVDILRVLRDGERLVETGGTSRTISAELRDLVDTPVEQLTVADMRRIVTLRSVPREASPFVGEPPALLRDGLWETARIGDLASSPTDPVRFSYNTRSQFERLRIAVERAELAHGDSMPDAIRAELRDLVAPEKPLDAERLRRLAVLDGLPDQYRGVDAVPQTGGSLASTWQPLDTAAHRQPVRSNTAARTQRLVALSLAAFDDHARSPGSKSELTDELALLLARDPRHMDAAAHERMARIAAMPAAVRPELPKAGSTAYSLAEAFVEDMLRTGHGADSIRAARTTVLRNSDIGIDEIVREVRRADGSVALEQLHPTARDIVVGSGTQQLRRLGISDRMLLRDVLESTRASGDQMDVGQATREASLLLPRMVATEPGEQAIIDQVRWYVSRNLDRIEGRRYDGYKKHPDYAEHGRAIEGAVLLSRLADARAASTSAVNVTPPGVVAW